MVVGTASRGQMARFKCPLRAHVRLSGIVAEGRMLSMQGGRGSQEHDWSKAWGGGHRTWGEGEDGVVPDSIRVFRELREQI